MQRNVIAALVIGIIIGATSATALSHSAAVEARQQQGTVWSAYHAAIPHDAQAPEPAPTF